MDDFDFTQNYRDKCIVGFYVVRYGFFEDKDNYAFHRLDGPACVYRDGREDYFVGDERHRIDGPAIYVPHNEKENKYYQNGQRHLGYFNNGASNDDEVILWLAQHWKMPCRYIKDIVRARQRENKLANKPEGCCVHRYEAVAANFLVCLDCGLEKHKRA